MIIAWVLVGIVLYFVIGVMVSVGVTPFFNWLLASKSPWTYPPRQLFVWPLLLAVFAYDCFKEWVDPPRDPAEISVTVRHREPHHWGSE